MPRKQVSAYEGLPPPPSPLSLTQGTTMRLTNQEKKIQKAVRREVPGEQRRRGRVRVRWCRICEKVRIAKLTGKRTVPCGTCGGLMLTAWVWREQLTEMSVHELRGLFLGIPVKWNSVSGDLEHGFRRSGTLVGA